MEAYLEDDLWLDLARGRERAGGALSGGSRRCRGRAPASDRGQRGLRRLAARRHRAAQAAGAHYHLWPDDQSLDGPDEEPLSARLVCNWATTAAEVARFLGALRGGAPA